MMRQSVVFERIRMKKQGLPASTGMLLTGLPLVITLSGFRASAALSLSGGKIAFTRVTSQTESAIYLMNDDGSGQVNITEGQSGWNAFPAWSPDGTQIAFISDREGGNWELYIMDADGSDPTRLTSTPTKEFAPAWSPDGIHIA